MVIQRIQSLLLLLAAALMAVALTCFKLDMASGEALRVSDLPSVLILGIVCGALVIVDIFLFKNLKLQMMVASISAWLIVAFIALGAFMVRCKLPGAVATAWVWPSVMSAIAIVLVINARLRMKADYRLLRGSDRLW